MNNKILILSILVIVLLVLIGYLFYNFVQQPVVAPNKNINELVEEPAEKITYSEMKDQILHQLKIVNQEIPYDSYYQALEFLTFCQIKDNDQSYFQACEDNAYNYLFDPTPDWRQIGSRFCKNDAYLSLIYFNKTNQQDKFMQVCNEYKDLNLLIYDCQQAWDSNFYENSVWCDNEAELCWPIVSELEGKYNRYEHDMSANLTECAQEDVINISQVDLNQVDNMTCKKQAPLVQADSIDDCNQIEDSLTKLICLAQYDNNLCNEFEENFINYQLPDFITKYNLNNCCFQGNKSGKAKYSVIKDFVPPTIE